MWTTLRNADGVYVAGVVGGLVAAVLFVLGGSPGWAVAGLVQVAVFAAMIVISD